MRSWACWTCCGSTPASRDRVLDYADKIAYSGRQLLDLVNDILEMSRLEQGKVTLNHQAFDLENCDSGLRRFLHPPGPAGEQAL